MERYNDYKDSGVAYINEIPAKWILTRNKYLAEIKGRIGFKGYTKNDFVDKGKGALVIGATEMTVEGKILINNPQFISWFKYYESPEIMLEKGHILIVQRGSTVGKVSYVDKYLGKATINPSLVLLKNIKLVPKYYLYYLMSSTLQSYIKAETSTTAIPMITQTQIGNYFILIPPLKEQSQIANYLDIKTTVIDKKIKLLKQKIKHYKAYRKTLINETVTKGLDKSIKLKDSGIDWIGEIPENWEVKRLKDVSKIFTGNSISDKSMFETKKDSFDYIATKDINIHNKKVNYDNGVYIPKKDKSFKITKKNTSLICLEGASAGNKLTFVDKEVAFVNKLCAIKSSNKNVFDKYIFYQLQSNLFRNQFFELLSGLIGGVSLGLLKYFNVVIPSKTEQQQIANYLDNKTATIDKIVNNIETQINTLKELRKTLINEVVTGKVKVS